MPIDHRRLFEGLNQAASMVEAGEAGLVALDVLISAVRDACGASGATFTEYGEDGTGRIVVARGDMTWALGQPIAKEFIDPPESSRPWSGRIEGLPERVAEPLLSRGVVALVGYPVRVAQRPVGALHLFFGDIQEEWWAAIEPVLRVVAASTSHILTEIDAAPGKAA